MKRFVVIVCLLMTFHTQAQVRIGAQEARATATSFLSQQEPCRDLVLMDEIKSTRSGQANLFIFTFEPQGYVIVSALDEVLAYSFTSSLSNDELPDPIAYWLELYNDRTDYLLEHKEQVAPRIRNPREVPPLLTSRWGQGCFYNEMCPADVNGPCQHTLAGCIAIAMAQLMYYYKQPAKGIGSTGYNCPNYGTLTANFGETNYSWNEMSDQLDESNAAVAMLVSHCGISVKMGYGPQVSVSAVSSALKAFHEYFLYPTAQQENRDDYDDEHWRSLIQSELDKRQPVFYTGGSSQGLHAFVCDGYNHDGFFHFNFGWNGQGDGYFTLADPSGFSDKQVVLRNFINCNSLPIHSDSHGIIYVASDGNGDGSSWGNATCDLQSAILKAYSENASVWVKEGMYQGNPADEYAFFLLHKNKLYGSFKGDEPFDYDLSQRNLEAHPSILDGNQIQRVIDVLPYTLNDTVLIDGFIIQHGLAQQGSGILLRNHTHVKNCVIRHNYANGDGGGISQHPVTNPMGIILEDCEFYGNEAKNGGALMDDGFMTVQRCHIHDNTARIDGGGIQRNSAGRLSQYLLCDIHNNTAQQIGGGVNTASNSKVTLWSCLIHNNTAKKGGGLYLNGRANLFNCTVVKNEGLEAYGGVFFPLQETNQNYIKNCIFWGNTSPDAYTQIGPFEAYSFCAVQDDKSESDLNFNAEAENDGVEPGFFIRFQQPSETAGHHGQIGNWRLQSNSYCIDRVSGFPQQPDTDLDGNPRLRHRNVDLGAYETDVVANLTDGYICGDEPYDLHGVMLSDTGIYTYLYQGHPYDSLVLLQLHTRQPSVVHIYDTICQGQTYDFLGTPIEEEQPLGTVQYSITIDCVTTILDLYYLPLLVPNPASDAVTINMEQIDTLDVFNLFGEHLKHIVTNGPSFSLDVTTYNNGIYLIHATHAGKHFYGKLLVRH